MPSTAPNISTPPTSDLKMLKFICGMTGTGKSEYIYSSVCRDIRDGKNAILIVPEQEVLKTELTLASRLDGINSLGLEVVSFRRLCNRIFREYGGLCRNYISRGGQALLMWRTLRRLSGSLRYFSNSDQSDSALIDRLLSFIAQLKAYKISPERFAASVEKLPDGVLRDKAGDLAALYSSYDALVHESYDDAAEDADFAHQLLLENGFFPNCNVYIDSFYGFTPDELDIISDIIAGDGETVISLLWNCAQPDANFERSVITRRQLMRLAREKGVEPEVIDLSETRRFSDPVLSTIAPVFWEADPKLCARGESDAVRVVRCSDIYDQAAWIASDIRRTVREEGLRYRDIAVISRSTSPLEGILDEALAAQGIPFHLSRREDIASYPIVRFIMCALRIAEFAWRRADVISYVKTGVPDVTDDECDLLENYAALWDINGRGRWCETWSMNPRGFTLHRDESDVELLDRVNEIRVRITQPLETLIDALSASESLAKSAECIYDFLCGSGAEATVKDKRDAEVWNTLCGALDDVWECGGDEECDVSSCHKLLACVFRYTSIGSIPSSADEVTIADAALARVGNPKRVYICSANDGVFPAAVSDDALFDDTDMRGLAAVGIEMENSFESRGNDELLYFHKSAFSASERVTLTYCNFDMSGRELHISVGCKRFLELIDGLEEVSSRSDDPCEAFESEEYVRRHAGEYSGTPLGRAIERYFEGAIPVYDAPISHGRGSFSDAVTRRLYPHRLMLTQSRIESFMDCPFAFTCNYILHLSNQKSDRYNAAEMGDFVHSVLEQFFAKAAETGDFAADNVQEEIDRITGEYIRAGLGSADRMSARAAAMFARLRRTSSVLIDDIRAEIAASDFRPAFFELGIGMDETSLVEPLRVRLSDGTDVSVRGKIDRVDICNIDGETYVKIVDYKTGSKSLKLNDAENAKNMQMLLYLFSICDSGNPRFREAIGTDGKLIPAGVEYYIARDPVMQLKNASEIAKFRDAGEPFAVNRSGYALDDEKVVRAYDRSAGGLWLPKDDKDKPALISAEKFAELDDTVRGKLAEIAARMKNGDTSVYSEYEGENAPCKYCAYRAVCRRERC